MKNEADASIDVIVCSMSGINKMLANHNVNTRGGLVEIVKDNNKIICALESE